MTEAVSDAIAGPAPSHIDRPAFSGPLSADGIWGNERVQILVGALGLVASTLKESAPGEWRFRLPGMRRIAYATLTPEWLSLRILLRASQRPYDSSLIGAALRRNARIDGMARVVARGARQQLVVDLPADDLPWHSPADLNVVAAIALADLRCAASARAASPAAPAGPAHSSDELIARFEEAGWPAHVGEIDALEVPLEVEGRYTAALVHREATFLRLSVSLLMTEFESAPSICRDAAAVLLWSVAGRYRMIRPIRSGRGFGLEVGLPTKLVHATTLDRACGALSLTLQQLIAEMELLIADEQLAAIYLENLGILEAT